MINQNIKKELEKDDKIHRLFNHQRAIDLHELSEILKRSNKDILLIEFSNEEINEIIGTILQDKNEESIKRSTQYIALKLLEELKIKDKSFSNIPIKELLESFKNEKDYIQNQDKYPKLEDVINLINLTESVKRVHIIMNCIKSAIICEGTIPLLGDNLNFGTSIYNAPNKFYPSTFKVNGVMEYLTILYRFIEFDDNENGILSNKLLKENKQCQHTKKYT